MYDPPLRLRHEGYNDCAALYVRMSTDAQVNSIETQIAVLAAYAQRNQLLIVRTFADEGKSGLTILKRTALQKLLECVQSGQADFKHILVLDVSRWGRFQDTDESAYYEYICKRAGVSIHYVDEQFRNNNDPLSAILKTIKRTMAAEYSRELSVKVHQAHNRLASKGYYQGGAAVYGLRRAIVGCDGKFKRIIEFGERKNNPMDHIILVPGPHEEVRNVQFVFSEFWKGASTHEIATILNRKKVKTQFGRIWRGKAIHGLLANEKYIGTYVRNKLSRKLGEQHYFNPPEKRIRVEKAYLPIIDRDFFEKVQEKIAVHNGTLSDDRMLEILSDIHKTNGKLSTEIINKTANVPSACQYHHRFGTLVEAYNRISYKPDKNYRSVTSKRSLLAHKINVEAAVIENLRQFNVEACRIGKPCGALKIHKRIVALVVCRYRKKGRYGNWIGKSGKRVQNSDLVLIIRMDVENHRPSRFYLAPSKKMPIHYIQCPTVRGIVLDEYMYRSLDDLCKELAKTC